MSICLTACVFSLCAPVCVYVWVHEYLFSECLCLRWKLPPYSLIHCCLHLLFVLKEPKKQFCLGVALSRRKAAPVKGKAGIGDIASSRCLIKPGCENLSLTEPGSRLSTLSLKLWPLSHSLSLSSSLCSLLSLQFLPPTLTHEQVSTVIPKVLHKSTCSQSRGQHSKKCFFFSLQKAHGLSFHQRQTKTKQRKKNLPPADIKTFYFCPTSVWYFISF